MNTCSSLKYTSHFYIYFNKIVKLQSYINSNDTRFHKHKKTFNINFKTKQPPRFKVVRLEIKHAFHESVHTHIRELANFHSTNINYFDDNLQTYTRISISGNGVKVFKTPLKPAR